MSDRTILFADIAGSTALFESLGDSAAEALVNQTLDALATIVESNAGTRLRTIGDEILCIFPTSDDAIDAAGKMHQHLLAVSSNDDMPAVSIRIGAHVGPVLESRDDVYGDTVNVAARMTSMARAGKTIISEQTFDTLEQKHRSDCRLVTETSVKGKEKPIKLYEVVWEPNDQLTRLANTTQRRQSACWIHLRYQGSTTHLQDGALTIGRGDNLGLTIEAPQASRIHCEIRKKGSKFSLKDNSTNGTYITQNGVEMFFHQEEAPLHNEGSISLGAKADANRDYVIEFHIKDDC